MKNYLAEKGIPFHETEHLHEALPELDALYVTRMQSEWDVDGESRSVDLSGFSIGPRELQLMNDRVW